MRVLKRFKTDEELEKIPQEERNKVWEKDTVTVEFSRDEFWEIASAVYTKDPAMSKNPDLLFAVIENIAQISMGKPLFSEKKLSDKRQESLKQQEYSKLYWSRRQKLKDNCKIRGADCPCGVRYDIWDLYSVEDIAKWDEKVRNCCLSCEHNINMLETIS